MARQAGGLRPPPSRFELPLPPIRPAAAQLVAGCCHCYLTSTTQLSTIARLAPEQFFAWVVGREERYELVDGEVVMMAEAGRRHDRIVVNLTTAVHSRIRGGPCQTFTGDTYVVTSSSTRRMPDLG